MPQSQDLTGFLDTLIVAGEAVCKTSREVRTSSFSTGSFVDSAQFHEWMASSLAFLKRVFGPNHTHTQLYSELCTHPRTGDANKGVAILRAARTDLQMGFLSSLHTLVEAEVFGDFLEMADHLIETGYKDPAASLIGAVLEDGLRKVALRNDIVVTRNDDLQSLSSKLADATIYNRLTQKRIKVWIDIRNHADHGHFSEYTTAIVQEMRSGVGALLDDLLR